MQYAHVIADEGAAGMSYQVIWNNPEDFKKIIIHPGNFHTIVQHFSIIGKIVSSSGFEDVLYKRHTVREALQQRRCIDYF